VTGSAVSTSRPALTERGHVMLRDGRRLGYSAAGRAGGAALLYMHGAIGSPVRRSDALERLIRDLDLRYVMLDRPGFGDSDPKPERTVADFARDVQDFADATELGRFSVVGVSAGVPYALACAWALPDRVAATACVSSVPPGWEFDRPTGMSPRYRLPLKLLRQAPARTARAGDRVLSLIRRHPGALAWALALAAPGSDRTLMREREARRTAAASFLYAARGGVQPMVDDFLVCSRPWGFDLAEVQGPVRLWHGLRDRLVSLGQVEPLFRALPGGAVELTDGDGHFFFRSRLPEIITPLVAGVGRPHLPGKRGLGLAA
jgi:pimeloyl-ACP methyl ester carboxylesterase